jgi:hexosaminidase
MTDYFNHGYQNHKAVGKTITFATPCSPKYAANGANSLIDGVCGTENYFCLWQGWSGEDVVATIDLGVLDTVHGVTVHALSDHMSWIFPAESVMVTGSSDGKQYRELGRFDFPDARSKDTHGIIPYEVKFPKAERCRFLKIQVKNIGKIPGWRGVEGMAWLFVDEIVVN